MKVFAFAVALALSTAPALAQTVVDPNKPDAELTKEEAEIRLTEWRNRIQTMQASAEALNTDMSTMRQEMTRLSTSLTDCNNQLYALLETNEAAVQGFRERLGRIEARTREMGRMSDAELGTRRGEIDSLEMQLNGLRGERISLLPEFYNKIIDLAREINGLRRTGLAGTYEVGTWQEDRDCLWNIAGKETTYNDPLMWPKIWLANNDKIRNPDLIYPGQVLSIPPAGAKSDEELRAERLYYRRKGAARRTAVRRTQQVEQQEAGSGN